MKKTIYTLSLLALLFACKDNKKESVTEEKPETEQSVAISNDVLENGVIYEANIRQYSVDGSFSAFTKDIPQLKQLGVKVIWLMPIFPISETKRKATGGEFASEIKDEAIRNKMLGSYYAVSDYTKVNPEFGTIEDFRELVKTAHDNGMFVILDWVPNHTGWDHVWLKQHPDFYTKNKKGEITDPLKDDGTSMGWADVADLNYNNKDLWKEMTDEMSYWITDEKIDGFRCDVAGSVPTVFWEYSIPKLREKKQLFMLAEAWEPELLKDNLFDMAYAWDGHHIMNEIAQGKKNVSDFDAYMKKRDTIYEKDDMLMNFITNHDENSWNGTIKERMGDAAPAMLALTYTMPGMPLVYSGMEYDMDKRLLFFEKDTIPKIKGKMWPLLTKLGQLKNDDIALNGGKKASVYERINSSEDKKVLAFKRGNEEKEVYYIANLTKDPIEFTLSISGEFQDAFSGETVSLQKNEIHSFKPWQYLVLKK